ncbi:MAG: transposase [Ruminococcaceae bacterium]|nr:transposase [Oscillospiraceae bacterium]
MEKNRKLPRLKNYDYSTNGKYFVTFCVKDMKCVLSSVVGSGDLDAPELVLSEYGMIIDKNIVTMNGIYNDINAEKYIIMPNHVHMIIDIDNNNNGASGSPLPTNSKLSRYIGTLKRFCNKKIGKNIWQTGFYDHIIRNDEDYEMHLQYIDKNPKKWLLGKDEYYT